MLILAAIVRVAQPAQCSYITMSTPQHLFATTSETKIHKRIITENRTLITCKLQQHVAYPYTHTVTNLQVFSL